MHRDIKGPNVMLTKGAEIRLIDFGKWSFCENCITLIFVSQPVQLILLNKVKIQVHFMGN